MIDSLRPAGDPAGCSLPDCITVRGKIEESVIEKTELSAEVIGHIKVCPDCGAYYESEKSLALKITEEFNSIPIPIPQINFLLLNTNKPRRLTRWLIVLSAAAAVLFITVTIILLMNQSQIGAKTFKLTDNTQIIASPASELVIKDSEHQAILKQGGELYIKANKNPDKPFQLITLAGNIIVQGTEFSVSVQEENSIEIGKMKISVLIFIVSGIVQLNTSMGDVIGTAGEILYAETGSRPTKK